MFVRFYILINGDRAGVDGYRILDVKAQGKPAIYPYVSEKQQQAVDANVQNDAQRVVKATKSMLSRCVGVKGYPNGIASRYINGAKL